MPGPTDTALPGGGKYDTLASHVREQADAQAVVLMVLGGKHGSGFTVQEALRPGGLQLVQGGELVRLLRDMADQIERGVKPGGVGVQVVAR